MPDKKSFLIPMLLSLSVAAIFIAAALFKNNVSRLDILLGTIWSFMLSLIISFSLFHSSGKK